MKARAAGFTIVELLVAMAVMTTVCGALVSLMAAWHAIARTQPETADQQQRARIAVRALSADLARAGAGVDRGPAAGSLSRFFPPIEPGAADAVTIWTVSSRAAQTSLSLPLLRGETAAAIDDGAGFVSGSTAIVYDAAGCRDVVRVEDAIGTTILLRAGTRACDYARGATFAQGDARTYRVDRSARRLLRRDEATGVSVPVIDGVTGMSIEYLDAGRRARITLMVSAAGAARSIPDLSVTFDVMMPNLWLS